MPDEHPYIAAAEAALRNAQCDAAKRPFPYDVGAPVVLWTPVGSTFEGVVERCDEGDGWLVIRASNPPEGWTDNPLVFHACSAPERIEEGVLVFRTEYRANGAEEAPSGG